MGSCAQLWALDASAFERLQTTPVPTADAEPYAAAEDVFFPREHDPSLVIARWQDDADNDLSRIATGERRGLPGGLDVRLLSPLLGLDGAPALPWWARTLWPAESNAVGLLAPPAVRTLRDTVRVAGLLEALAPSLARLDAFLDRAANAGCWILGVEGTS